jgi:DNA integrity scanning protein DisA with diadenylate cyclase activity
MDIKEFYQLIGQITYSFGRIDFLISNIAVDLELVNEYPEFYAKTNFQKKIKDLKAKAIKEISDTVILNELCECLEKLDMLREERNGIIHSIILENGEEYMFYNFKPIEKGVRHDVKHYQSSEIKILNDDFVTLHNRIYTVWQKLSNN